MNQPREHDTPVRVYLLDDHELVRRGLHDLLSAEPDLEIVGESGSARRATADIIRLAPDVAVLDGRLPDGSGIEVCRDVRAANPDIRALILTSYDDDEALFSAIMAGADGYVLKQIAGTDLVDGIRSIAGGRSLIDPSLVTRVMERLRQPRSDPRADKLALLTDQEQRILEHIAEGMTNRQIAQTMFLAEKTVKNYITNLLAKLGVERRTQAAVLGAKLFDK
ncbi:response regulator [Ornithinimicrobium cerasi]|uniref:Two component transcriptional regulator, LuxR family n=1 Tax=Ornithinimicrobium cerasi TaxID=2248773 RepID=A0A285VPB3_9MICO|nr:response regulator transcription factor [Ornithinimicrobium cerasi]SOC55924.1 two component transcriptional regulator, LuxR family [Ornithinimicrobium cerasi]